VPYVQASDSRSTPKYVSTDNDPWYRFYQWQDNLRMLEVTEIKTVPDVPYPIRLENGSSGPYAENAWTARFSGPRPSLDAKYQKYRCND
jgi:hypothetical protein